jgi:hypothetical protein
MSGKGDWQRPRFVSEAQWAENWERAFGKKEVKRKTQDGAKESVLQSENAKSDCKE